MKKIAVLLVFRVMFGVCSPAFAERSWKDVAIEAGAGGLIGAVIGGRNGTAEIRGSRVEVV
ncbi:MAG: hypothetical protein II954_01600 [Synergistaceae bacterium]|nr:hypothetical protein [Synergistaceae bacterium]